MPQGELHRTAARHRAATHASGLELRRALGGEHAVDDRSRRGVRALIDPAAAGAHGIDDAEEHAATRDVPDRERAGAESLERVPGALLIAEFQRVLEVPGEEVGAWLTEEWST